MSFKTHLSILTVAGALAGTSSVSAIQYGGIEFPSGAISFADAVVSYDPLAGGGPAPTAADFLDPSAALGVPDYGGGSSSTGAVSLGDGGSIVLQFLDNFLTGSDNAVPDLHIFEVGPDIEDTYVDISVDGFSWISIGKVSGSLSSIDIDSFGYGSSDTFSYVRLIDDTNLDGQTGATVGADIDAVGAISTTRNTSVPDSGSTFALLALSAMAVGAFRRFRKS